MSAHFHSLGSPWPHRWAWALACATFPLVWWGGFVTATGSGMAFREWLRPDGHFLLTYPWLSSTGDKFIEHGHRLLGALAGLLTLVLVGVSARCESRRWVRKLSWLLAAGVVGQGVLGGLRVVLDRRVLALVHGCVGPAFFALCAAMVVVTSAAWRNADPAGNVERSGERRRATPFLTRAAVATAIVAYLQLALGALVRHGRLFIGEGSGSVFEHAALAHVGFAVVTAASIVGLTCCCLSRRIEGPLAIGLFALVVMQLGLGMSSWLVMYGQPAWAQTMFGEWNFVNSEASLLKAAVVTAHGAAGSLIVALSVGLALRLGWAESHCRVSPGSSFGSSAPMWKGATA